MCRASSAGSSLADAMERSPALVPACAPSRDGRSRQEIRADEVCSIARTNAAHARLLRAVQGKRARGTALPSHQANRTKTRHVVHSTTNCQKTARDSIHQADAAGENVSSHDYEEFAVLQRLGDLVPEDREAVAAGEEASTVGDAIAVGQGREGRDVGSREADLRQRARHFVL